MKEKNANVNIYICLCNSVLFLCCFLFLTYVNYCYSFDDISVCPDPPLGLDASMFGFFFLYPYS